MNIDEAIKQFREEKYPEDAWYTVDVDGECKDLNIYSDEVYGDGDITRYNLSLYDLIESGDDGFLTIDYSKESKQLPPIYDQRVSIENLVTASQLKN